MCCVTTISGGGNGMAVYNMTTTLTTVAMVDGSKDPVKRSIAIGQLNSCPFVSVRLSMSLSEFYFTCHIVLGLPSCFSLPFPIPLNMIANKSIISACIVYILLYIIVTIFMVCGRDLVTRGDNAATSSIVVCH